MSNILLGAIIVSVVTFFLFNAIKALNNLGDPLSNSISICIVFVLVILAAKGLI